MHRHYLLVLILAISYFTLEAAKTKKKIEENVASDASVVSKIEAPLRLTDDRVLKISKILLKTGAFYKSVQPDAESAYRAHVFLIRSDPPNTKKTLKLDCTPTMLSNHRNRLETEQSVFQKSMTAVLSQLTKKNYQNEGSPALLHMESYHPVLISMLRKSGLSQQADVLQAEWTTLLADHRALLTTLADVFSQIGKQSHRLDKPISVKNTQVQLRPVQTGRDARNKPETHLVLHTTLYRARSSLQHPKADPLAFDRAETALNELFKMSPKETGSVWKSEYLRKQMYFNMDTAAFEKFEAWLTLLLRVTDATEKLEPLLSAQKRAAVLKEYHFLYSQYIESSVKSEFLKQWEDTCKGRRRFGLKRGLA